MEELGHCLNFTAEESMKAIIYANMQVKDKLDSSSMYSSCLSILELKEASRKMLKTM